MILFVDDFLQRFVEMQFSLDNKFSHSQRGATVAETICGGLGDVSRDKRGHAQLGVAKKSDHSRVVLENSDINAGTAHFIEKHCGSASLLFNEIEHRFFCERIAKQRRCV